MGKIYTKLKKFEEAKTIFETILKKDPKNHLALSEYGWRAYLCQEYDLALEYTKNSLSLNENYLYLYRLGRIYWSLGGILFYNLLLKYKIDHYKTDKDYCLYYFLKSAKLNPQFAPTFSCLGDYYSLIEKDQNRGLKCYQKSVELDPMYQEAIQSLIRMYMSLEKRLEAEKLLIHSCEINPRNAWAHKQLALLLLVS